MARYEQVAHAYLTETVWGVRTAKKKYLKAIDYAFGLLRRLQAMGLTLPGAISYEDALKRMVQLRRDSQQGLDLKTILENRKALGAGKKVLEVAAKIEGRLVPDNDSWVSAFISPMPDKKSAAVAKQSDKLISKIRKELGIGVRDMSDPDMGTRVMKDVQFFNQAYAACLPILVSKVEGAKSKAESALAEDGRLVVRAGTGIKRPDRTFGKQRRKGRPFWEFTDLTGVTGVTGSVAGLIETAARVQSKLDVIEKENYFLMGRTTGASEYNAVHYLLQSDWLAYEFQIRTDANLIEVALSHDLLYKKVEGVPTLTDEQKKLVALVIDVSTQLSFRDWEEATGIAMKMAQT